ncbi:hypothetical protein, partial [Pseudomonas syringae group genomosp. 7]|uniref:hypothetical protein n=1 Tax=Pseudomonas syringae group genomosp. 7 TaxID=251699 RepID=UPI0037706E68
ALLRDLEAARYAADRAFRQYDAADPHVRIPGSRTCGEPPRRLDGADNRCKAEEAYRANAHQ